MTPSCLDMTLGQLVDLLRAANDGGVVMRRDADGTPTIRSRSGVTIHEDEHGHFAGVYFATIADLVKLLKERVERVRQGL